MITFNNNPQQKEDLLKELKMHQELDRFIQGTWTQEDEDENSTGEIKGCFYGCTMQTDQEPREKFSAKYNIDLWYCYVTEKIFEGLPQGEFETFPFDSINILPVGFDINKIKSRFHYLVLEDQLRFCEDNEDVTKAIKEYMTLFEKPFNKISESAARSVARSAARSAAESAARSAAESAWSAAESAARSAAESAWSAAEPARSNYYIFLKNTLLKCVKEAS